MNPMERVSQIIKPIEDIDERWSFVFDEIHKTDLIICDIEHEIENTNLDVRRGYLIYKELQKTRKYRRQLKNEQEQLKPLYDFYQLNKKVFTSLTNIKNATIHIKKCQDNWIYNKRIKEGA